MQLVRFCLQCEKNVAEALQYVQPVQVIPVGSPVPAVAVGSQPYIPTQNVYPATSSSSNNRASSSYDAPTYSAPKPSYTPPRPSYQAPTKASYNPPPRPSYNAPSSSYGAPTASYGAPSSSSYLSSKQFVSGQSFQTGFGGDDFAETQRPTREGRLEECYCVPASQCPPNQVIAVFTQLVNSLGSSGVQPQPVTVVTGQTVAGSSTSSLATPTVVKDYSALINPRVKNSELNITAADEDTGSGYEFIFLWTFIHPQKHRNFSYNKSKRFNVY